MILSVKPANDVHPSLITCKLSEHQCSVRCTTFKFLPVQDVRQTSLVEHWSPTPDIFSAGSFSHTDKAHDPQKVLCKIRIEFSTYCSPIRLLILPVKPRDQIFDSINDISNCCQSRGCHLFRLAIDQLRHRCSKFIIQAPCFTAQLHSQKL